MTTNLFVIANIKQLRTSGSFRIVLPFFSNILGCWRFNSAVFNSFHNRVEFGTILEGLRNFGGGGFETPKLPVGTPLLGAVGLHNVRWYRYTAIGVSQQRDHKHTQPPTP